MEIRLPHTLAPELVQARLEALASRHDVTLEPDLDARSGTLEKTASFLGRVRARYEILPEELLVTVTDRPALLPEGTLRRALERELSSYLEA